VVFGAGAEENRWLVRVETASLNWSIKKVGDSGLLHSG
jgi:hypothetical protein